jgi:hypothetical protein
MIEDYSYEESPKRGNDERMPMPVYVKDGIYYLEGIGHVDKGGNRIIGLPSDFYKNPFDVAKTADDVNDLHTLDEEIDSKVLSDE